MFFQEVLEVVFPVGTFLFGDFEITILIDFVIVKGGAFNCFKEPAVFDNRARLYPPCDLMFQFCNCDIFGCPNSNC